MPLVTLNSHRCQLKQPLTLKCPSGTSLILFVHTHTFLKRFGALQVQSPPFSQTCPPTRWAEVPLGSEGAGQRVPGMERGQGQFQRRALSIPEQEGPTAPGEGPTAPGEGPTAPGKGSPGSRAPEQPQLGLGTAPEPPQLPLSSTAQAGAKGALGSK